MMPAAFQHPQSYMAPKMLDENENAVRYNFFVDMWAIGVMINEMLTRTQTKKSAPGELFVRQSFSDPHVDEKVVCSGVFVLVEHRWCHV